MTAPTTLKPSALVAAAHIIASDGPGEVVRKLDAAFDAAVPPQAPASPTGVVGDMAALVKKLVQALRQAAPNHVLPAQALDYLKRHGLQGSPLRVHSDDAAVDRFSAAMKAKLAAARAKGRGGWKDCHPERLSRMLREHVEKGDPRDVANFCMFLWHLDQPITEAAPAAPSALSVQQMHPLETAPKDGTIVQLLIQFVDHPPGKNIVFNAAGPLTDTADPCWTIGGNTVENTGVDHWQFVGWNWEQDCFVDTSTEAGHRVLGWAPFDVAAPAVDAEMAKKAARYDFLRSRDLGAIAFGGVFASRTPDNVVLNGDDLDAAIDAAMATTAQQAK